MPPISYGHQRVLSGMRPTGPLHLGHYHGVLKNWIRLQHEYECFFFVADWHALTTHYDAPQDIQHNTLDMVIDWLAVGIDPGDAVLFIQSRIPEHAELHLLLSMVTPLGWLERVPSYKEQQERLHDHDLNTYGFLGYPVLQSADILIYRATQVPVGEDQVAHIELTRELARRFNYLFGREVNFEERCQAALRKIGGKNAKRYEALRNAYQEQGDGEALVTARVLVENQKNISLGDQERLLGYLDGSGKAILTEPQALLTDVAKLPGLDGRKMSKSCDNTIHLRMAPDILQRKLRTMPTDPARVRISDPGDPQKCPVWQLHQSYTDDATRQWVENGCRSASIGCISCKQPLIDAMVAELQPIRERAKEYQAQPDKVRSIITDGCERARDVARETLTDVRQAMGLGYR